MEVCLRPDLKRGAGISWSTIVGIVARISQRGVCGDENMSTNSDTDILLTCRTA